MAAAPADAIVVYDVPLLVEGNLAAGFDLVVVVEADAETRLHAWPAAACPRPTPAPAWRPRPATSSDVPWPTRSIGNDGDRDELARQVDALWAAAPATASGRLSRRGSESRGFGGARPIG